MPGQDTPMPQKNDLVENLFPVPVSRESQDQVARLQAQAQVAQEKPPSPHADDPYTKGYIKTMRVELDRLLKNAQALATTLNRGAGARNVALCITHLEDARMRLGKALGDLGHELPEEYRDEAK